MSLLLRAAEALSEALVAALPCSRQHAARYSTIHLGHLDLTVVLHGLGVHGFASGLSALRFAGGLFMQRSMFA